MEVNTEVKVPSLLLNLDDPELAYRRRGDQEKRSVPWGQRKLFINELLYLIRHLPPDLDNPIVVYAGAAPGKHIPFLSSLFPKVTFYLYDPSPFQISETPRIKLYQEYFTFETANQYKDRKNILFISDIRTADHLKMSPLDNELSVWKDMELQRQWYEIIRPVSALLKFRLPYLDPKGELLPFIDKDLTVEYLSGLLYRQPWAPQTSTECRLVPDGKIGRYNIQKYESQMFYHNVVVRETERYQVFNEKDPEEELLEDYDSSYEIITWKEYLLSNKKEIKIENIFRYSRELTVRLNGNRKRSEWYTLQCLRKDRLLIKRKYSNLI